MKKYFILFITCVLWGIATSGGDVFASTAPVSVILKNGTGEYIESFYNDSDKAVTASFKNTLGSSGRYTLVASSYNKGTLVSTSIKKDISLLSNETCDVTVNTQNSDAISFFAWNDLGSMKPIIPNVSILKGIRKPVLYVSTTGNDGTGDGTYAKPYKTINTAISKLKAGSTLYILDGTYNEQVTIETTGTSDNPIAVKAAPGAHPVIKGIDGERIIDILPGVSYLTIEGLELYNGSDGIYYEASTSKPGGNITIRNNKVHDVGGENNFGIVFYAKNVTPTRNIVIDGNEVYNCKTGGSETVTLNGNIDGFTVINNYIHDCNNIGLDAIGYEKDVCPVPELNCARNGIFKHNTLYKISTEGNDEYKEGSGYDLCCAGIYVDGGHDIIIEENNIDSCNLGIEVASEHSGKIVYNVTVRNNNISNSDGFGGLVFGGYNNKVGFTKNCVFSNNTLYNNISGIVVQQATGNVIEKNIVYGGNEGLMFSFVDSDGKLVYKNTPHYGDANTFNTNYFYTTKADKTDFLAWFRFLPDAQRGAQITNVNPNLKDPGKGDFTSTIEGYGSSYRSLNQ